MTLLQIAANPYAAILGKPENVSARLNLAQAINYLGTKIAPIAGGLLLYEVFAKDGKVTLDAIQIPYLVYGGMFLALAGVMAFVHLPRIHPASSESAEGASGPLAFPQLTLGMVAIFVYVGSEVALPAEPHDLDESLRNLITGFQTLIEQIAKPAWRLDRCSRSGSGCASSSTTTATCSPTARQSPACCPRSTPNSRLPAARSGTAISSA